MYWELPASLSYQVNSSTFLISYCLEVAMPNQHKPLRTYFFLMSLQWDSVYDSVWAVAPLDMIAPDILRLWKARQTDKQILEYLRKHIDTTRYGIG